MHLKNEGSLKTAQSTVIKVVKVSDLRKNFKKYVMINIDDII